MCKGQTYNVKDLKPKSGGNNSNTFFFNLQVTVKWESKSYISDETS
jgi:hypothetical protein